MKHIHTEHRNERKRTNRIQYPKSCTHATRREEKKQEEEDKNARTKSRIGNEIEQQHYKRNRITLTFFG